MLRFEVNAIVDAKPTIKNKLGKQMFERAMHHVMILARNEAKNHYCPVKTGMLRDSIYIRKTGDYTYELGATMYYGVWHEFGSYNIAVGTMENPNLIKTGYSPFLRPALWRAVKSFPNVMQQNITNLM